MTDNERITNVLRYLGKSARQLANETGVSSQCLYNIKWGKTHISRALAIAICKAYPSISYNWLFAEHGEMLTNGTTPQWATTTAPETKVTEPTNNYQVGPVQPTEMDVLKLENAKLCHLVDKQEILINQLLNIINKTTTDGAAGVCEKLYNVKK